MLPPTAALCAHAEGLGEGQTDKEVPPASQVALHDQAGGRQHMQLLGTGLIEHLRIPFLASPLHHARRLQCSLLVLVPCTTVTSL